MPVESHAVAHTVGKNLHGTAVPVEARDGSIDRIILQAYIAGRPHGHIETAVGAETNEFPAVAAILGKTFINHLRLARRIQSVVDPGKPENAVDLGDIQITVPQGHTVGHIQPLGDGHDPIGFQVAVCVNNCIDPPLDAGADINDPCRAQGHAARPGDPRGVKVDLETGRHANRRESYLGPQVGHQVRGARERQGRHDDPPE